MGSLHTSADDNSFAALQSAPGWITTRYFAGNFADFSCFSSVSLLLSTFNFANVLFRFECPFGLI